MQRYNEVAAPANIWDIQPKFVTNDMINGGFWDEWRRKTMGGSKFFTIHSSLFT